MRMLLRKTALLAAPLLAAISLIGLSRAGDPVSMEGWKALSIFSVLACLSLVAEGARRAHVELREFGQDEDMREKGREAA